MPLPLWLALASNPKTFFLAEDTYNYVIKLHLILLLFSPDDINVDSRLFFIKVRPSQRLNFCRTMGALFDETSFANLTVTDLKIWSLGKTPSFFCRSLHKYDLVTYQE